MSVGPLRARILARAQGLLQDVVIAGHDRELVTALFFPNLERCRALCAGLAPDAAARVVLDDPRVVERIRGLLRELAGESTGSSTFVARALVLDVPPSLDAREVTDKGSLNQKAVLENRSALVSELYAAAPSPRVITAEPA